MDKYLDRFAETLRIELDDLSTLAREGNAKGVSLQCSYLMGMHKSLIVARETAPEEGFAPSKAQLRAQEMALAVTDAIFVAHEVLKQAINATLL